MIGTIDVNVQAKFPAMPLDPMQAYVGSPSSIRVRNVPKKIGNWNITRVQFVAAYPDSTIKTAECVLVGGVWVGTIEGTQTSGKCLNGYSIYACGIDENGSAVSGYCLGKGDIEILKADGTIDPDAQAWYMKLYDEKPDDPNKGDVYIGSGMFEVWNGEEWFQQEVPLPSDLARTGLQTSVSEFINDVGYITASAIPSNISAFNNDVSYITATQIEPATNQAYVGWAQKARQAADATNATHATEADWTQYMFNVGMTDAGIAVARDRSIRLQMLQGTPITVAETYTSWNLSSYLGTEYDPALELTFMYVGTRLVRFGKRTTNLTFNSWGWFNFNSPYVFIKAEEGSNGRYQPVSLGDFSTRAIIQHTITLTNDGLSIATLDGEENQIVCSRSTDYPIQTVRNLAFADELPSVPSNISAFNNDVGYITASASAITSKRDYTDLSMPPPYNTDYWTRDDNGWFFANTIEDHWSYDHGTANLSFINGTWQYSDGFEAATCEGTSSDTVLTFTLGGTTFTLHRAIPNDVLISKGQVQAYVEPFATSIASIGAGLSSAQASITSLASSVAAIDVTKIYNDAQNKTKYVNGDCQVFQQEMVTSPWSFSDGGTREVMVFYQDDPYPDTPWIICGSDCHTLPYPDCFYSTKEEAETTLSFTYPFESAPGEWVDVVATRTRSLEWVMKGTLATSAYVDSQIGLVLSEAF